MKGKFGIIPSDVEKLDVVRKMRREAMRHGSLF